jgi:hypothetical protein
MKDHPAIALILFTWLLSLQCQAQQRAVKGEYVDIGIGSFNEKFFHSAKTVSIAANVYLRKDNLLAAEYVRGWFFDPGSSRIRGFWGYTAPVHIINSISLYDGRYSYFMENSAVYIEAGPCYVHYIRPENIKLVTHNSWLLSSTHYEYDEVPYDLLGCSIKGGVSFVSKYKLGLGLNGFYTWNRMSPYGGIEIALRMGSGDKEKAARFQSPGAGII